MTIAEQTAIDAVLADLNDQQREAASHSHEPLLIVAGAGTGKTTTLAHRVAYLIAGGVDPSRVLLLTFTRRAAAEMLRRVDMILRSLKQAGAQNRSKPLRMSSMKSWGGTFHATAARLLRQHGKLIGLDPGFTILDRSDSEDLLNVLRADLGLANTDKRFPLKGTCLDIYSRCVNTQRPFDDVLKSDFPWCSDHGTQLKQLFETYVDRKEAQAVLDYDDLLLFWHALVTDPGGARLIRDKFDCVLVDEYQDTNVLQAQTLKALCPDGQGLTVVGDDAQSIYSFRAATVKNILDFPQEYPGTRVVTLEQNYRSTQPILDVTNRVIAHAAHRHAKNLWSARGEGPPPLLVNCADEDEQTDYVIDRILEHRETGTELKKQAVLFRASHHSLALEVELSRRNIPYHKYGGLKFIETAHVKDLLGFLKLAENPRDAVAGTRVLMLIPGIGHKKARQLMDGRGGSDSGFSSWNDFNPPAAARTIWPGFLALMQSLAASGERGGDIANDVHQARIFYGPLLEQKLDHAQARLRDLEQIEQVSTRFPDRATFLTQITLDPPASTQELPADPWLDEDYLNLSTIHSAKGLEWDSVFVIHAADGNIPSDMATGSSESIEEERRLFYVALTRARNSLYVCHPDRYYFHGRRVSDAHSFAQLTRFVADDVRACFERRAATMAQSDIADEQTSIDLSTADIRRRVKRMWT